MSIEEQIAALEAAIAKGVRRVVTQSQGVRTEVEYHSIKEMEEQLTKLKARKSGRSRIVLAAF